MLTSLGAAAFLGLSLCAQDAPPPAAAEADDDSGEIRFIAHNLENWLRQDRFIKGELVKDIPKPEEQKDVIISMLARVRPRILGVCEIGDLRDVDDFRERLKHVGLDYPHVEWVNAADSVRHLALLSQFPIVARNSQTDLSYKIDDQQFPVWRGLLDVTLQLTDDYQLRCVGAHLKSKREVPEASQALMRRNEADLLRKHVDGIFAADPEVNLLVYGDFNDTRNEAPIKAVQGKFGTDEYLTSLKLEDSYGFRWTHHWDFADQYSRIDYIFVSRGLTREINRDRSFIYHRKGWDEGSDHRPLVTAIRPVDLELQ